MSQEREIQTPSGVNVAATPELTRAERKAKLASILERGIVGDRLYVDLPSDVHGEWVPDDPLEIHRMQALGFEVDKTYSVKRALHAGGDGVSKVGDVVFMTCPMEIKEIVDEIRLENYHKTNTKGYQKEEKDFAKDAENLAIGGAIVESKERDVKKEEISALLNKDKS